MAGLIPFNKNRNELSAKNMGLDGFYNMLDDFFTDSWLPSRTLANDTFKLDIKEDEKEYHVEAELPGIKKEEVEVELHDGRLVIGVNRSENTENKTKNYVHRERCYSSVQRAVYLGDVQEENIKAKLENGVLVIDVPKSEKKESKHRIEVK